MLGLCSAAGLPCVRTQFGGAQDFRGDFKAFRAMAAVKVGSYTRLGWRHRCTSSGTTAAAKLALALPTP